MSENDTPESRWRIVRLFLILAGPAFCLSFFLGLVQGASWQVNTLLGAIAAAGCFGAALAYHLMGPASKQLLYVLGGILALANLFLRKG